MPKDLHQRDERRQFILDLLERQAIGSQEALLEALVSGGYGATQSSISRDLRDLGVAKVGGRYVAPRTLHDSTASEAVLAAAGFSRELIELRRFVRRFRPAGPYMTVVSTLPGAAQTVASALDLSGWPELVGTVAGDDTIFVATATPHEQKSLHKRLERWIQERS